MSPRSHDHKESREQKPSTYLPTYTTIQDRPTSEKFQLRDNLWLLAATERREVGRGRLVRKITSSIKGGDNVAEAIRVAFVFLYTWTHFNIKLGLEG